MELVLELFTTVIDQVGPNDLALLESVEWRTRRDSNS